MNCSDKKHDCASIITKVFLALDGELSPQEEIEFMEEVKRCSWCLEHYEIEQAFKEFLCKRIQRKEVSPNLVISIREKIRQISIE